MRLSLSQLNGTEKVGESFYHLHVTYSHYFVGCTAEFYLVKCLMIQVW